MNKVLILGGFGNFGKRIARLLTRQNIAVIISGRDADKAKILVQALPDGLAEMAGEVALRVRKVVDGRDWIALQQESALTTNTSSTPAQEEF